MLGPLIVGFGCSLGINHKKQEKSIPNFGILIPNVLGSYLGCIPAWCSLKHVQGKEHVSKLNYPLQKWNLTHQYSSKSCFLQRPAKMKECTACVLWNCSLYYNSNQANSPFTWSTSNETAALIVTLVPTLQWCIYRLCNKTINVFIFVCTNWLLKAFLMQLKKSSALNCILLTLRVHKAT